MQQSILRRFVAGHEGPVSREHVLQWFHKTRQLQRGTVRMQYGVIRCFCSWLVATGVQADNPCDEFPSPVVPRSVPRALNMAELARLWDVLPDDRARVIVALGVGLGLRRAEIAGLELGDWDAYGKVIVVRHQTKGGSQRVLPVPDHVATCIERYLRGRIGGAGPLIRASDRPWKGVTANRIGFLITQWMFEAGIKTANHDGRSTHALRHSFAQLLYRHGGDSDLRLIQHALGHSHLSSTEIYMRHHLDTERLRTAMSNVDYGLSA